MQQVFPGRQIVADLFGPIGWEHQHQSRVDSKEKNYLKLGWAVRALPTYRPTLYGKVQYPSSLTAFSSSSSTQHRALPRPKTAERRNCSSTAPIEVPKANVISEPGSSAMRYFYNT